MFAKRSGFARLAVERSRHLPCVVIGLLHDADVWFLDEDLSHGILEAALRKGPKRPHVRKDLKACLCMRTWDLGSVCTEFARLRLRRCSQTGR